MGLREWRDVREGIGRNGWMVTLYILQCSKLSIDFVHTQGAERLKTVHPANFVCVQAYTMYRNGLK